MKKINIIALLLLLLSLCLTACGAAPTDPEPAEAGTVQAEAEWQPQVLLPEGGGAGTHDPLSRRYSVEQVTFTEDPAAMTELPAFVNPYGFPLMTGPEYEVTPEMRETTRQRVADFLDLLYGDYTPEKYPFVMEDDPYHATYRGDDLYALARIDYLVVASEEEYGAEIAALLPNGDLRQSPLLAAALDYMGLDDWVTECEVKYDATGEVDEYQYLVYQRAEDSVQAALNRAFSGIEMTLFPNDSYVGLKMPVRAYENYEVASTAQEPLPLSRALDAVELELPQLAPVLEPMKQEAAALEQAAKLMSESDAAYEKDEQAEQPAEQDVALAEQAPEATEPEADAEEPAAEVAEVEADAEEQAEEAVEVEADAEEQTEETVEPQAAAAQQSNLKARAVYRYDAKEGYIIPCWELYIPLDETASDGTPLYSPVYVPMANTAALADRF